MLSTVLVLLVVELVAGGFSSEDDLSSTMVLVVAGAMTDELPLTTIVCEVVIIFILEVTVVDWDVENMFVVS